MQIDYKKAYSLMNKHENQHSADKFVKNIFNRFHDTGLFLYSVNISENQRFPDVFRGGKSHEIGWKELVWKKWVETGRKDNEIGRKDKCHEIG